MPSALATSVQPPAVPDFATRARQVRIHGLVVSFHQPLLETAIFLPPQVCDLAQLLPGETLEIHNLVTGGRFVAPLLLGKPAEVQVNGYADPDLSRGDVLQITAGERIPVKFPPPGTCTTCVAEGNYLVEIHDARAPARAR